MIINVTPHPIRFQSASGDVYEVASCGVILNVRFVEEVVEVRSNLTLVRSKIVADPSRRRYEKIKSIWVQA
jgi:hypothetical protein